MKQNETKVYLWINVACLVFCLLFFVNMGRRVQINNMILILIGCLIGLIVAVFIAMNYEKGKNWARIWMFILNYGGIVALISGINDLMELSKYKMLENWANFGIVFEASCAIASIYVIIQLHAKKKDFEQAFRIQSRDPEEAITKLKNMMDKGLISQEDYEMKKAQVLDRI